MRSLGAAAAGTVTLLVFLLPLAGCAEDGTQNAAVKVTVTDVQTVTVGEESPPAPPPPPPPPPAPDPNPDAKFTSDCSYILGDFTGLEFHPKFLGDANVRNTGNVGIVVNVKATWAQAGSPPVAVVKKARLEPGKRKAVRFNYAASSSELDLHQAVNRYPACKVKVTIIDTFGEPQE